MDFRVLGPLEVRDGERMLALGGPKRRALAALLLLAENRPVSTSSLVDGLWGDEPPAAASSSLQNHVSRLRAVLGDRLETTAAGYLLRLEEGELDLQRFRRLLQDARRSDAADAAARLREALALWRGPVLADLDGEPAREAAAHLDDLRLTAVEERIDADLALGRHSDVVPELEALTAEHPFRERLWGQLVLALYRAGRQASALDAYARGRRALVDALGAEPGPALRELHAQVLRQDPALGTTGDTLPPPEVPDARASRRTVTVLAGAFARAGLEADPEARRERLRRLSAAAAATIERHGGTPASAAAGDRCLGVFGAPLAHEDDALRAVRAALDLRASSTTDAVALATGEVVTGSPGAGEPLVSGSPLELAGELLRGADAGTVVACERTWRLVRHAARGDAQAGHRRIDAVEREAEAVPRRLEAPLVGRDEELGELRRAFERTVRELRPRLVTVFGEPGIGKTRLALEATGALGDEATVLTGRCAAYAVEATYAPLGDVVAAATADGSTSVRELLGDEADAARVIELVESAVGGGAPAGAVDETAWAFRRLLESVARTRPVVLVLEDVHAAAPGLLDLVEHVVEVGRAPILVLCLARPDLLDGRPSWAGGKLNAASLLLQPLSRAEAERLLDGLPAERALDADARARVVEVAAGHPLYLEQLAAALTEDAPETVPDSIATLLAARLDRLPAAERDVLEAAATCGITFSSASVAELVERDVRRPLESLVRRDLLQAGDAPFLGEETWAFRHALIHDAAYRSVPKRRRAALHERFAERLERLEQEREMELDELVGFHLAGSVHLRDELGETGTARDRLAARAARRLAAAGLRAYERGERAACRSLLTRAIALFGEDDDERADALLALAASSVWSSGQAEARGLLAEVRRLAERRGDAVLLARVAVADHDVALWTESAVPDDRLLEDIDDAIAVLAEAGDHRGLAAAYQLQFHALDRGAPAVPPSRALERALHHARLAGSPLLEGWAQAWLCIILPFGAVPLRTAIRYAEDVLRTAPSQLVRSAALGARGLLHAMNGEFEDARRLVLADHAILGELGLVQAQSAHSIARAEVEIMAGELDAAEQLLRAGYEHILALGDRHTTSNIAWRLALVLTHTGRDDEAEQLTRVSEETSSHSFWVDVWWRVVRAGVAARAGRHDESDDLLSPALASIDDFGQTRMGADAWIEAAGALRALGREDAADALLARAENLARRLGYAVSEQRAHALRTRPAGTAPPAPASRSTAPAADA